MDIADVPTVLTTISVAVVFSSSERVSVIGIAVGGSASELVVSDVVTSSDSAVVSFVDGCFAETVLVRWSVVFTVGDVATEATLVVLNGADVSKMLPILGVKVTVVAVVCGSIEVASVVSDKLPSAASCVVVPPVSVTVVAISFLAAGLWAAPVPISSAVERSRLSLLLAVIALSIIVARGVVTTIRIASAGE